MKCSARGCGDDADVAIASTPSKRYGMTHTIYSDSDSAPRRALRYCVLHGMQIASGVTALSNNELGQPIHHEFAIMIEQAVAKESERLAEERRKEAEV